jgi:pantothenate kinase
MPVGRTIKTDGYSNLFTELRHRVSLLTENAQYWIGLAGAPGSGKSTLAAVLKEQLGETLIVIPMDGYHYYRSELDDMNNPQEAHARRGAPFTFNATKFVDALMSARNEGEGCFPAFDHQLGDPVEDSIRLTRAAQIVLVEGNYLLLDEEPWCQLRDKVFDETWFLQVPIPECNRRVLKRLIKTGLTEAQAQLRVETNDSINAQIIVEASIRNADRVLQV